MKFRVALFFLSTIFLIACGTSENKKVESNSSIEHPKKNPVDELQERKLALVNFNNLEKIFDNQNYLLVKGKDTSYCYFSRLNNYLINVHNYKILNGDSAYLNIDTMQLNETNQVVFNWKGNHLILKQSTQYTADWNLRDTNQMQFQFKKVDQNNIQLIQSDGTKLMLKKTLTLSTFLIRSFYDYQHGTKLAFDSIQFTKR